MLRQILTVHGISFEAELERRKAALRSGARHTHTHTFGGTVAHSHPQPHAPSQAASHSVSQDLMGDANYPIATPPTTASAVSPQNGSDYTDTQGGRNIIPSYSGSQGFQNEQPGVPAESNAWGGDSLVVDDIPGIFEKEPQLGVEFILS